MITVRRVRGIVGGTVLALLVVAVPVSSPAEAATIECGGKPATILGTDGDDVVQGTPGDDRIAAGAGDDIVRGRGGDDTICGSDGDDRMWGGHGRDILLGDDGSDQLFGGGGPDSYLDGVGDDRAYGGRGADYFIDGPGDDVFNAGVGDDDYRPNGSLAIDLADHDRIRMGMGNDHVQVGSSHGATVDTGAGDDDVVVNASSPAPLSLTGGAGDDSVHPFFWSSTSVLTLDQSADRLELDGMTGRFSGWELVDLYGPSDVDYTGQEGPEVLNLVYADGTVRASMLGGDDEVYGTYRASGPHFIDLGAGDDVVNGGMADDVLRGGPGADVIWGADGDDLLDGGTGKERLLDGGEGSDTAEDPDDDPSTTPCYFIEIGFCADPTP